MRIITHLDADAFFASVEQAADPRLRGKPVAVGGEKRGIIASASYQARQFGVYTPMPTARARRLCPKLIVLPGDFEKYERFSRWMFSYAYDFTPDVEITSLDEGYFDLSGARRSPVEIAQTIRRAIGQALKISVSEGIGANKLVSQIASKLHKPAAFTHVPAGREIPFLHPLPNRWLPGIGPKTATQLRAAGLARIGQIAATPVELLELLLGRLARTTKEFANGIDDRPLLPAAEPAKSYGQQETFAQDQTDEPFLEATLQRMADQLMARVRAEGKSIRAVTVKVRYHDMAEDQCSESLLEPTDLETDLYPRLRPLLRQAWKRRVSLRLVSLKFSKVYEGVFHLELPLERVSQQHDARRRLAAAADELRRAYGPRVLRRGHDFLLKEPRGGVREPERRVHGTPPRMGRELGPGTGARSIAPHAEQCSALRDPGEAKGRIPLHRRDRRDACPTVPLVVRSYYSFLNSTLSPAAIVQWAQQQGLPAVALCDQGNLHGAVEFAQAAQAAGLKPIFGAELRVKGRLLWLYVQNATGYANLCRILSVKEEGRMKKEETKLERAERADSHSSFCILPSSFTEGLLAISPDPALAPFFPDRFYLGISSLEDLRQPPETHQYPRVPILPVHYATAADRWKYDVLQSIRTLTLLAQAHPDKKLEGEFHFRTPAEMQALFKEQPQWLANTLEIAERCCFEMPLGPPQFPAFQPPDGSTSKEFLRKLVREGLHRRYSQTLTHASRITPYASPLTLDKLEQQLETELSIIAEVGYEAYFLVVWDILQECRRRGIDWITRGSAADSLVCYCLGISDVCPIRFDLYFRRFLNKERMALNKLPDIDIDFPHDRKDDVIDLIFEKYGPDHCAVVGGFSTFQARSAFAEVAKVLGVAEREVRRFTEHFPWSFPKEEGRRKKEETKFERAESADSNSSFLILHSALSEALRSSPETRGLPLDEEPYRSALALAEFLDGFPRYAKMHPCGVVLSRQPMRELTPTFISQKGYPTTHYDMDAVEAIGLVKIDILAQGGLAVMRDVRAALAEQGVAVDLERFEQKPKAAGKVRERESERVGTTEPPLPFPHLPTFPSASSEPLPPPHSRPWRFDDPEVWDLIASGGARAVHHIESPAMISLCRMCQVRDIDTLIAIVSVIRPGAANEDKKREFTRRYQGLSPVTYPHSALEPCLRSTFGLVVYEEHILQICEAFAGLPPGRADVLRRALNKEKHTVINEIRKEFFAAARRRGHAEEKIAEVWDLVRGFAGYAFCKAHSTAYGVEAYQSAWLKRYFPAEFMAAVLTHGKGFYHPLVYVLECWRLGFPLLSPWVNEPGPHFVVKAEGRRQKEETTPERANFHSAFCLLPSAFLQNAIRVPLTAIKGLTGRTTERLLAERTRGEFVSLGDFYRRVGPAPEEMELLIRAGAFDGFGRPRTRQFWGARQLQQSFEACDQGWLFSPPDAVAVLYERASVNVGQASSLSPSGKSVSLAEDRDRLEACPTLTEPTRQQRLQWEAELFGYPVSGHPLELHGDVAWETYCPVAKLGEHVGRKVVTCGLIIEQRVHHQVTGEPMKFLTLCDWTGMVETELFAATYKSYGLATVRYPVLEITATVEPFENSRGFSLRVHRAGKPRRRPTGSNSSDDS